MTRGVGQEDIRVNILITPVFSGFGPEQHPGSPIVLLIQSTRETELGSETDNSLQFFLCTISSSLHSSKEVCLAGMLSQARQEYTQISTMR